MKVEKLPVKVVPFSLERLFTDSVDEAWIINLLFENLSDLWITGPTDLSIISGLYAPGEGAQAEMDKCKSGIL